MQLFTILSVCLSVQFQYAAYLKVDVVPIVSANFMHQLMLDTITRSMSQK